MSGTLFPLIVYVLVSTFTPGPSNISSASMGVLHGYRRTLNYLAGLAAGFFGVMLVSGLLSTSVLSRFPSLEPALRIIGAAYIVYLALGILNASYSFVEKDVEPLGFAHGLLLQVLNPKLIVYSFTLFAAFLAPVARDPAFLLPAVGILTLTAFCATSIWTLSGSVIRSSLDTPRVKRIVNLILALCLLYTAVDLVGFL